MWTNLNSQKLVLAILRRPKSYLMRAVNSSEGHSHAPVPNLRFTAVQRRRRMIFTLPGCAAQWIPGVDGWQGLQHLCAQQMFCFLICCCQHFQLPDGYLWQNLSIHKCVSSWTFELLLTLQKTSRSMPECKTLPTCNKARELHFRNLNKQLCSDFAKSAR